MNDENAIEELSIKISSYNYDLTLYRKRMYIHLLFVVLSIILPCGPIIGYGLLIIGLFLFVKRVNKRFSLANERIGLVNELNNLVGLISIETYFEFKRKIVFASRF